MQRRRGRAEVEAPAVDAPPEDAGVAGSSARREYERRKAKDEERLRQKWGKLGGIAVALSDEKQSTKAWATGAVGEERLGARLDSLASESVAVLHDRRIPGTKANIDHIAITRAGIWVIDAKRYKGRPELKIEGGILRPRIEKVLVGRRDCTKLVDGVLKQVDLVREVVERPAGDRSALLRRSRLAAHRRCVHHPRRSRALAQAPREAARPRPREQLRSRRSESRWLRTSSPRSRDSTQHPDPRGTCVAAGCLRGESQAELAQSLEANNRRAHSVARGHFLRARLASEG